jgi:hypothetical protein
MIAAIMKRTVLKQSREKITTKKPVLMKHNLRALVAYSIESKYRVWRVL